LDVELEMDDKSNYKDDRLEFEEGHHDGSDEDLEADTRFDMDENLDDDSKAFT
jgi:hypothetical protein